MSYILAAPIRLTAIAADAAGAPTAAYTLANVAISVGGPTGAARERAATGSAKAETMSSTNYRIQTDVLSQGGGSATSAGFWGDDTIGDLATGDMGSSSFRGCAGYECFQGEKFITFEVAGGTSAPGTPGDSVNFGTLTSGSVTTSNHTTINSAFIQVESNAIGGVVVSVADEFNGLKHVATPDLVESVTATLTAGTAGYGVCVFDASEGPDSPSALTPAAPYDGSCDTTTGHDVGAVSTSAAPILTSSSYISEGQAEVLVKAAISGTSAAGAYSDTLTFVASGTF